jgi:hypothetical protein
MLHDGGRALDFSVSELQSIALDKTACGILFKEPRKRNNH